MGGCCESLERTEIHPQRLIPPLSPLPTIPFNQSFLIPIFVAPSLRRSKGNKPKGFWRDIANCRAFLDQIAKELGFDPLDIKSWDTLGRAGLIKHVRTKWALVYPIVY